MEFAANCFLNGSFYIKVKISGVSWKIGTHSNTGLVFLSGQLGRVIIAVSVCGACGDLQGQPPPGPHTHSQELPGPLSLRPEFQVETESCQKYICMGAWSMCGNDTC